jgi:hypothetical protein
MQGISKSIIVAVVVAFVTPALALAAADERAAAKGSARKAQVQHESAARQHAAAQRQAAVAAKMSLVRQMQGNSDPALRTQMIRQQMQGGK